MFLGGAVGSVLGGWLANRYDRVRVSRWSYLLSIAAVTGVIYMPGPAMFLFVALTSAGLYVPFSLQVTLGQDYLPSRIGTASGVTLGLTVSIGGLISPLWGHLADSTSLRMALTPLIAMPALSWLLFRTLPEPAAPSRRRPHLYGKTHRSSGRCLDGHWPKGWASAARPSAPHARTVRPRRRLAVMAMSPSPPSGVGACEPPRSGGSEAAGGGALERRQSQGKGVT